MFGKKTNGRMASNEGHAVVIGGSIAGLTAARVLVDHFAQVTLIERDPAPDSAAFRNGVPQARHPHVLLLRGQQILEQHFPGLVQELHEAGACSIRMSEEFNWVTRDGTRPHFPSDIVSTACSRPLLEGAIYRRLVAHPQVRVVREREVTGLCVDATGRRATGVRLRSRGADQGESELQADLVVDASGRGSRAPQWLAALGLTPPRETTINAAPGYASRIVERPAGFDGWKVIYVQPTAPDNPRGAIVMPLEGNRWHVCLIGMAGDHPPTDEAGFAAFARSLAHPAIYEALQAARPLSPIWGFRRTENRLRHYDQLPRFLEGFVVFGDAVYALNPVYGQGMTVAALASLTLDQCIREQRRRGAGDLTGLARRFHKALPKVVDGSWQLATGEDRRWPGVEGGATPTFPERLVQGYIARVLQATLYNTKVTEAFYRVQQMVKPPASLFHPAIVFQVLTTRPPNAATQPKVAAAQSYQVG